MIRVDMHVHTYCSRDSLTQPAQLLSWIERRAVDMIAVTDHDAIEGALEMASLAPGAVIVGEEIRTTRGEIIGLFLNELIPPGLAPGETADRIHVQGGLVYIPHPLDRLRGSTLARDALLDILPQVDVLEGYNARVVWPRHNLEAQRLAAVQGLAIGAGSDAHRPQDVGLAVVEMPRFEDAAGFLVALSEGRIDGRLTGPVGRLSGPRARLTRGWKDCRASWSLRKGDECSRR